MGLFSRIETSTAPLPQEVYVWQQDWSQGVLDSVNERAARFSNVVVITSEIRWDGDLPRLKQIDLPFEALARTGRPVGMGIRIGIYRGSFATNSPATAYLERLIRTNLEQWKKAGIHPSEIQLDFDCPESRLKDYLNWIVHLKTATGSVPMTLTVLPSWLDRRAFREIAAAADGYVLQVHSFEHPKHPSEAATLCDPGAAVRYVEMAARLGKPFCVALPTYGYRLFYDDHNELLGIAAEGSSDEWSQARTVRELRANSREMASLVSRWTEEHPAALEGVVWFRLPVPEDSLNWSWPELAAVMEGRPPRMDWSLSPVVNNDGLVEIVAENRGECHTMLPSVVHADWSAGRLIAADGLNSFRLLETNPNRVTLTSDRHSTLAPGRSRVLAWLRFDQPTEVNIEHP